MAALARDHIQRPRSVWSSWNVDMPHTFNPSGWNTDNPLAHTSMFVEGRGHVWKVANWGVNKVMNQRKIWQNESEIGYSQFLRGKRRTWKRSNLRGAQRQRRSQLGVHWVHWVQCREYSAVSMVTAVQWGQWGEYSAVSALSALSAVQWSWVLPWVHAVQYRAAEAAEDKE
jgi:hypothetical protein